MIAFLVLSVLCLLQFLKIMKPSSLLRSVPLLSIILLRSGTRCITMSSELRALCTVTDPHMKINMDLKTTLKVLDFLDGTF